MSAKAKVKPSHLNLCIRRARRNFIKTNTRIKELGTNTRKGIKKICKSLKRIKKILNTKQPSHSNKKKEKCSFIKEEALCYDANSFDKYESKDHNKQSNLFYCNNTNLNDSNHAILSKNCNRDIEDEECTIL